jgi:hypothetical protein
MKSKVLSIKGLAKEGNSCLFFLFAIFNFVIFLCSMGTVGCAVYLFVITKEANAFNIGFLVVGLLIFLLSLLAFKMRTSVHLLCCYLVILFVIFTFMLIITIVMIVQRDALVSLAEKYLTDSDKSTEELEKF